MVAVGVEVIGGRFAALAPQDPAVHALLIRQAIRQAEGRYRARFAAWRARVLAAIREGLSRLRRPRLAMRLPRLPALRIPRPRPRPVAVPALTRAGPAVQPVKIGAP